MSKSNHFYPSLVFLVISASLIGDAAYAADLTVISGKDLDPNAVVKLTQEVKPPCDPAEIKPQGKWLDFITLDTVKLAYPLYNRPYPESPHSFLKKDDMIAYRPNHGIAHVTRVAADLQDLMETILNSPEPSDTQTWLKKRISADPQFFQKVGLMALAHRSGRVNEEKARNEDMRDVHEQLENSGKNFVEVAKKSDLKFSDEELNSFKEAIRLNGKHPKDNVDTGFLSSLLRAAHVLDLFRDHEFDIKEAHKFAPDIPQEEWPRLEKRAQHYLSLTGDERYNHHGGYGDQFVYLSTHTDELAKTILDAQKEK